MDTPRKVFECFVAITFGLILVGCTSTVNSHTVSIPNTPLGPTSGTVGQTLTFSTGGSSCSRGHPVEYRFDWGDGTYSSWSSSPTATKTWYSAGTYQVRAQARCAADTSVVSGWSSPLSVSITTTPFSCISVKQLLDEFKENEVAARMKYEGRRIYVCGYVDSVRVNELSGRPYVTLAEAPNSYRLAWVFCDFTPDDMPALAQLKKGQHVVISGYFDTYLLGSVWLNSCRIE